MFGVENYLSKGADSYLTNWVVDIDLEKAKNIEVSLGGKLIMSVDKNGIKNIQNSVIKISNVIYNDPATIVYWSDGTRTVVKCQAGDTFDKELGLALAISKKFFGNKGNFNEQFKKWCY